VGRLGVDGAPLVEGARSLATRDPGLGDGGLWVEAGTTSGTYQEGQEEDSQTLLGIEYMRIYRNASKSSKPFVFVGFVVW
jgi:hypothetical protein